MKVKGTQLCPTLCDPKNYTVHGVLQARIPEWVAFPFSRESSQPRSPTLKADSLSAEPLGKPKNTGVGSLSLLQRIFPTQELNQGLLHCRRILYQLSYEGSPEVSAILNEGLSIPTHCVPVTQESVSIHLRRAFLMLPVCWINGVSACASLR